jgi:Fe-S cluster assembly protein SufD
MNTASIIEQFDAQQRALPELAQTQRWRRDALDSFNAGGFPTRRDEQWRYTDLKPLQQEQFDLVPQPPEAGARDDVAQLLANEQLDLDGPRLVFVDGHLDAGLSRNAELPGVRIGNLADSIAAFDPEHAGAAAGGDARATHPLAALNTAFVRQGAVIELAAGVRAAEPLQLVFVAGGRGRAAPQPRIVLELAAGASAVVVQHFIDGAEAEAGWLNLVTDAALGPAASLTLYRLQAHGRRQFHTSLLRVRLARDACVTAGYVDYGGRLVRNDIDVSLAEPGARADLFGVVFAGGEQHLDNHVRVDHQAPHTTSVETFRAIVGDAAHGVFGGKVIVRPNAQRIDARQTSDNLLLSNKAEIDTKPALEIYADDVKCSHGATIGELDESQLFYLRSRGIDAAEARALLTFAFAQTILERINLAPLRERAGRAIAGHLPDALDMEALR